MFSCRPQFLFDLLPPRLPDSETDSWSETSIQSAQATLDIVNNATRQRNDWRPQKVESFCSFCRCNCISWQGQSPELYHVSYYVSVVVIPIFSHKGDELIFRPVSYFCTAASRTRKVEITLVIKKLILSENVTKKEEINLVTFQSPASFMKLVCFLKCPGFKSVAIIGFDQQALKPICLPSNICSFLHFST